MIKRAAIILAINFALLSVLSYSLYTPNVKYDAIAKMVTMYHDGSIYYGTGFAISDHLILTAGHNCVEDNGSPPLIITYNKKMVTVEKVDMVYDMCLLSSSDVLPVFLDFADELDFKEPVTAIGYPASITVQIVTSGVYAGIMDMGTRLINVFSCPIFFGNSGGPYLNADGDVVGMSTFIYDKRYPQVSGGVDFTVLLKFMAEED